jgi:muconolactone delta-isomerase
VKFLVIWKIELSLLSGHVASAVARMPGYAKPLERSGQIAARYHIVGAHGGAWVYDVGSNEELERLIALMPVYNFAHYTVYPLAEMPDWEEAGPAAGPGATPAAGPGTAPATGPGTGPGPGSPAA